MAEKKPPASAPNSEEKPATPTAETGEKAVKEKKAAVEDKPFNEFIEQDYLPALQVALAKQGVNDLEVALVKQKLPVAGLGVDDCWQVVGKFQKGQRQFYVYFPKQDIKGPRVFSYAENGTRTTTIEPFLMDERKITLDLLVFGLVQRLNAQKWLKLN
jgi:hypothetical protein